MNQPQPKSNTSKPTAQDFFRDAANSFELAQRATSAGERQRYTAMGADYISLAHEAAKLEIKPLPIPTIWP
jgi:hypothetical protein